MNLSRRFAVIGGIASIIGMLLVGHWVGQKIERSVTRDIAGTSVGFVDSFISPIFQDLSEPSTLNAGPHQAFDELMQNSQLGEKLVSIKIWRPDGMVVFSSGGEIDGQKFPVGESLTQAFSGEVAAEVNRLSGDETSSEIALGIPLLEIYSPLRKLYSGEIIGAAEFYMNASDLIAEIRRARFESWLVVAGVFAGLFLGLFGIVHSADRLIRSQEYSLRRQIAEISEISELNKSLRMRIQKAAARSVELNEQYLRRIGADLHDGPAQLIGMAAMRLDSLNKNGRAGRNVGAIRDALDQAMLDIRTICKGLSVPDIENMPTDKIVRALADRHSRVTGNKVATELAEVPHELANELKICLYRFVQEGLANAYRHGDGTGEVIRLRGDGRDLVAEVLNHTIEQKASKSNLRDGGLGLVGLRERVKALGGSFDFEITDDSVARLSMRVEMDIEGEKVL